ncbi:peptidoglycan DD-metalloendopeptidase family protein [Crossiella sp. NPDC003009]
MVVARNRAVPRPGVRAAARTRAFPPAEDPGPPGHASHLVRPALTREVNPHTDGPRSKHTPTPTPTPNPPCPRSRPIHNPPPIHSRPPTPWLPTPAPTTLNPMPHSTPTPPVTTPALTPTPAPVRTALVVHPVIAAMALALLTAALAGCAVAGADPTAVRSATPPSLSPASTRWTWPLPGRPPVLRRFTPPQHRYGPGHRGIDLGAPPGTPVLAAATGVVTFAGPVAGRGVVTLHHPNGLHTTYEPLTPQVRKGQHIPTATPLGHLTPGHPGCPAPACLHWGLRRHHTYLNPLHLLTRPTLRLLPLPRPTPTSNSPTNPPHAHRTTHPNHRAHPRHPALNPSTHPTPTRSGPAQPNPSPAQPNPSPAQPNPAQPGPTRPSPAPSPRGRGRPTSIPSAQPIPGGPARPNPINLPKSPIGITLAKQANGHLETAQTRQPTPAPTPAASPPSLTITSCRQAQSQPSARPTPVPGKPNSGLGRTAKS